MAAAVRRGRAGRGQPVLPVLADGLQHPVPGAATVLVPGQYGLLHQAVHHIDQRFRRQVVRRADGRRGPEVEAAREDRDPGPQGTLPLRAQRVAPVHQRAQGPLPGQGGTAAERQQRETVLQAGEHLVEGEGAHPGRGEFDRQWQPVQALDQLRHRLGVVLGDLEPGQDGRGAPAEQLHRRAGEQLPDRGPTARDRRRQRRHHEHLLPGDAQHVAAGRQHADTGRGPEQGVGQARAGVDEVLAVVQHKQQPPAADMAGDHVEGGAAGLVHQAQRGGHGMGQQLRVAQPGQLHDAHPVAERAGDRGGGTQRHPGLADAPGPRQRDQPRRGEQPPHLRDLGAPPDQGGEVGGNPRHPAQRYPSSHGHNLAGAADGQGGRASPRHFPPCPGEGGDRSAGGLTDPEA